MMEVSGFLVALTLAFLSFFIAKSFKLPALAILLLVASLVGPYGFSIVGFEEISVFSSIGILFLLFMIGLEFKTSTIIRYGSRGFVFALIKMSLVSFPIFLLSVYFFNLNFIQSLLLSIGLSITSTAIFSQIAKSLGVFRSSSTKQLFAELIWEDVFAVFLLILINSFVNTGDIELSFITSLAFFTVPYFIVRKISEKIVHRLPRDTDVYFLFSMAIAGVLVIISSAMDVPIELAAFLAGSIAANFKEIEKIKRNLNVLSSTFILFFFFSLGMEANLSIFLNPILILFVILVLTINALFKVFSTSLISLGMGSTPRIAAFSGLLMMSVGEFSLLLAKETSPLFQNFDIFSLVSGVVFISSLISWYSPALFPKYSYLLSVFSKYLGSARKRKMQFLFSFSYKLKKLKADSMLNILNTLKQIESQLVLTILLLLISGYSYKFIPSYLSPFISRLSLLLALVIFLSSLIYIFQNKNRRRISILD